MPIFILLLSLISSTWGHAQPSASLYEVVLEKKTSESTQNRLKEAFRQLIYRLTPGHEDLDNPVIFSANPKHFLRTITQQNQGKEVMQHFAFDPEKINRLMREGGQQPWIKNRPELLTWVTFVGPNHPRKYHAGEAVTPEQSPEFYSGLEKAARKKGLTLVYPDPFIRNHYPQEYSDNIKRLYHRLKQFKIVPQAVLHFTITDARVVPTYYVESWGIYYNDMFIEDADPNASTHPKRSLEQLGQLAVEQLSQFLFEQGEKETPTTTSVYVKISNIKSINAFHAADNALRKIPGVQHAEIVSVTVDSVLYTLSIAISPKLLDARLSKQHVALLHNPKEGILSYRFQT